VPLAFQLVQDFLDAQTVPLAGRTDPRHGFPTDRHQQAFTPVHLAKVIALAILELAASYFLHVATSIFIVATLSKKSN
jgi:hypothetical protein